MARLENKVAIITGAARGIGRGIALRFAEEGCAVCVSDVNLQGATETAIIAAERAAAKGLTVKTLALECDVTKRESVDAMVAAAAETLGSPNVLVNNAGIFFNAPFHETTEEQFDRILTVNVKSVLLVSQAVIRLWMAEQIKGSIISLASISASVAFVNSSAYCTTKAAVASMTRCMALEYGPLGIRANSMAPGIIDTAMLPSQEDNARWVQSRIPLRRLGYPDDVADVALFLASEDSRYVTGDMIYVDGGWMLE
jgi:NAD(P)-dependent dehydrogenase (short-subunit alcohol dehydrogenase family)